MTSRNITNPALRQIDEIFSYIARDNVQAASDVVARIYEVIDVLVQNPRLGRRTVRRGVRMFVVTGTPYLIFFQYFRQLDALRVLSVRHGARRRIGLQDAETEFRVES